MNTVTKELREGDGHIWGGIDTFTRRYRYRAALTVALFIIAAPFVLAGEEDAKELAKQAGVIFA
jgi:hypothetical protein